jgi:hypothetical protein
MDVAPAKAGLPRRIPMTCATRSAPSWPPYGAALRALQAWFGHAHITTTEVYTAYSAADREADMITAALPAPRTPDPGRGSVRGAILSEPQST